MLGAFFPELRGIAIVDAVSAYLAEDSVDVDRKTELREWVLPKLGHFDAGLLDDQDVFWWTDHLAFTVGLGARQITRLCRTLHASLEHASIVRGGKCKELVRVGAQSAGSCTRGTSCGDVAAC